jgi:hypothetical protein
MELRSPHKLSIDPRRLVREKGNTALAELRLNRLHSSSTDLSDVALSLDSSSILFGGPQARARLLGGARSVLQSYRSSMAGVGD